MSPLDTIISIYLYLYPISIYLSIYSIYLSIYNYIYLVFPGKKKNKSLLKAFRLLPLSIHFYQQVIFLLWYILKRIYKS